MPPGGVHLALASAPDIAANATLNGYLRQTQFGAEAPTTRATYMVFEQLDTALELTSPARWMHVRRHTIP